MGDKIILAIFVLVASSLMGYCVYADYRVAPDVVYGDEVSEKPELHRFYKFVSKRMNIDEEIAEKQCNSEGATVFDYAGYKRKLKGGGIDRSVMQAIEPMIFWEDGWHSWSSRLYKKAPIIFRTSIEECVLYRTRGIRVWGEGRGHVRREAVGNIVLSCCWWSSAS